MANYVLINSMKRHERSNLCLKLFNEMWYGQKMYHLAMPLGKIIDFKIKSQNKFKPSKGPIYAITSSTHKGVPFYIFVDKVKKIEVVFNTSPIDASYVEFTRVIGATNTNTMVYTQHALDRYNERVHGRKYDNYKDIIKRLIVNNPMKHSKVIDDQHKIAMRVHEGFLCGTVDTTYKILIINTFFDKEEYEDNKLQHAARIMFNTLNQMTPIQLALYENLRQQLSMGQLSKEDFEYQLRLHFIDKDAEL